MCGQITEVQLRIENSGVILSGISEHFLIFVNQYLTNELLDNHVTYKVRIMNRACYDKFSALLSAVNWDGICNQMIANVMFAHLIPHQLVEIIIHFRMPQEKLSPWTF